MLYKIEIPSIGPNESIRFAVSGHDLYALITLEDILRQLEIIDLSFSEE